MEQRQEKTWTERLSERLFTVVLKILSNIGINGAIAQLFELIRWWVLKPNLIAKTNKV